MKKIFIMARVVWLEMLRRKDVYVLLILMGVFLFAMLALDIFGLGGLTGYVKEVGLLLLWICAWVLTIGLAARQLPREESTGTILPLLAKPLTRGQLLVGKWLGAWVAGLAAGLAFHLLLAAIVAARGAGFQWTALLQHLLLLGGLLAVLAAAALLFSTRLHYDAAVVMTYVFSLGAFFIVPRVPQFALHARGLQHDLLLALYFALPHLELFDMRIRAAYDWGAIPWTTLGGILLYGACVTGVMLLLAWTAYRGKCFSRAERL